MKESDSPEIIHKVMVHQSQARADRFSVCCQDEEEASFRKKHDTHNKTFHTSIHAQFRIKVTHLL